MARYGYSIKDMHEKRAHAVLRDAPISYKVAVLIGKHIKGMPASKAITFLQAVQATKQAVPYTRFNDSVGHKPGGLGPGRYPLKAAKLFEMLLKSAVANAEDKGLGKDVAVEIVCAQNASRSFHYGRQGRRRFKRAHVELVLTSAGAPVKERSESKAPRRVKQEASA